MAQETLRSELKFALMCQPGKDSAALDGDGDHVVPIAFFNGRVPREWLHEIRTELHRNQLVKSSKQPGERWAMGVNLCEFHRWVANKVQRIDQDFTPPDNVVGWGFLSEGLTASKIQCALSQWARQR